MSKFTDLGEAFSEEALAVAQNEISQGFRMITISSFRGQPSVEVKIKFPSVEVDSEASKVYSKTMSELMMGEQKVVTRAEMEKEIKERGIWGQAEEDEVEAIDDRIMNLMRDGQNMHAKKNVNKKRMDALKEEYALLKEKKNKMITMREGFMSNTVEGMADVASLEYKLYRCCEDKDGKQLWATLEDFNKEHNRVAVVELLQKAMFFWSGLPQGVLGMLPEEFIFGEQDSEQSQEIPSGS